MKKYPALEFDEHIVQVVGDDQEAIDRWRRFCLVWKGCGHNVHAVLAMLEEFARGGTGETRQSKFIAPQQKPRAIAAAEQYLREEAERERQERMAAQARREP